MDIEKERVGDTHIVTARGRIDGIYSTAFANEVGALITGENPKVLIDFTEVDSVTSAGLRAVMLLVKKAKAAGGMFALCCVQDEVRDVLDVSGFTGMLSIHADRSAAFAAMAG